MDQADTRRTPSIDRWRAEHDAVAAVLVLHGGQVRGHRPVGRLDLPYLRMRCLARNVHAQLASEGIETWSLRYSVQGWNGAEASPVADAEWALDRIAAAGDLPVALLGHSMGGRTALRVVGAPTVTGVVALAPWLPSGERMGDLAGRRLVIAHGTADHTTDPRASRNYAAQARGLADDVRQIDVAGDGHAMLRRPATWNRIAAEGVLDVLGIRRMQEAGA